MSTILALLYISIGVALSETYAYLRRRAEEKAYMRGKNQAIREKEMWEAGVNQYSVTIPRALEDYNAGLHHRSTPKSVPVADEGFMKHLEHNGRATVHYHKGAGKK